MGGAMLAGWQEAGLASSFAIDPSPPVPVHGINLVSSVGAVPVDFVPAAVILAVKPQNADVTLPAYARFAGSAVFLSIMAGRSINGMRALLGPEAAVIRAMPNTPAAVRQGITVATAGPGVSAAQRGLSDQLLRAIGQVAWVDDEALLDPVTAISGGGPAYVFLLAELLEKAGIAQGLAPDLARLLARATVSGSGALLAASSEESDALRRAVTSPKGTTERALAVLMADDAWPAAIARAISDATARSRELAN
jgi:pyrroline-5-carboxylate reductase